MAPVDLRRLLNSGHEPNQWLITSGDWHGSYFSQLTSINRENVTTLGFAWAYATGTRRGLEATPLVVDETLFTSGVAGRVYALDAATGALKWQFVPDIDPRVIRDTCCDEVNKGVAVWKGRVYVAALDGWLYALDAASGSVVWKTDTLAANPRGYSSTGAPQVAGNVVVIGNAGGEFNARGYITAYDLNTGVQRWRFYTVPGDSSRPVENPELAAAARTWDEQRPSNQGHGGQVWNGTAYDPELDVLYVGTGNAAAYSQRRRSPAGGDNLFTCSILALRPATGRLLWYYQETPADQWDFDSDAPIVLVDKVLNGVRRKLLLHAPKNGLFYVLDRTNGALISAAKFASANWTTGVDPETGRPRIDAAAADYSGGGAKLVYPSVAGAHNWNPMAYSPQTGLVYLPTVEAGNILYDAGVLGGRMFFDTGAGIIPADLIEALRGKLPPALEAAISAAHLQNNPGLHARAFLQAWDPIAQRQVWRTADGPSWDHAGVLANAGELVFQGSDSGKLNVFDATDGRLLKSLDIGTSIIAAPMEYEVAGVTYVAVMAGWGGAEWSVTHAESAAYRYGNAGRILAFKLGGGAVPVPPPLPPVEPIPPPPDRVGDAAAVGRGAVLFATHCSSCHSNQPRATAPDLLRMSPRAHASFEAIVLQGTLQNEDMPSWRDILTPTDTQAIHAYLIDLAARAYQQQQAAAASSGPPGTGAIAPN